MARVVADPEYLLFSNRDAKFMDRETLAARLPRLDDNHSVHAGHSWRLVEKASRFRKELADLSDGNCFGCRRIFVRAFVEGDKCFVFHRWIDFAPGFHAGLHLVSPS